MGNIKREDYHKPQVVYIKDGDHVRPLYGRTVDDMLGSLNLVTALVVGQLLVPGMNPGQITGLPLTDDGLAVYLLFKHGRAPWQIAEAIRSLRLFTGDPTQRLIGVLSSPELFSLNAAVKFELTGEMS
jgi:hypothetical protein